MRIRNLAHAEDFVAIDGTRVREIAGLSSLRTANQSLSEAVIPPGVSTVEHLHRTSEEIYLVHEGSGQVRVDDEARDVRAGDCVVIAPGSIHSVRNTGTAPLRIYCFCSPPYRDDDTVVTEAVAPTARAIGDASG